MEPQLTGIGSVWPDWQYILTERAFYIYVGCVVRQESGAYLYSHGQIDLIYPLPSLLFYGDFHGYYGTEIIQDHPAKDFMLNIFRGLGIGVCGSYGVLQVTKRGFDGPSGVVKSFEALRRELFFGEVCHKAFKRTVGQLQPDDAEREGVCAIRTVFQVIEGSGLAHEASVVSIRDLNFPGVAANKGNGDGLVKGTLLREVEIPDKPLGKNILGSKQEKLSILDDVRHIVIGTIPPVAYVDVFHTGWAAGGISHAAERPEFVFFMDRLEQGTGIHVPIQIIESIDMEAVKALRRMSLGYEIVICSESAAAEKRNGGAASGNAAVSIGDMVLRRGKLEKGAVE